MPYVRETPFMSTPPHLRIPGSDARAAFPLRVALGALEPLDQVMMRNHLRQLSGRLGLDLIPTTGPQAEIRASYQQDALRLELHDGHSIELSRPPRLQALIEALQDMAARIPILRPSSVAPDSVRSLLLPYLRIPAPLQLETAAGPLYVDPVYRYVWSTLEPAALHAALKQDDHIGACQSLSAQEFQTATARSRGLRATQLESLCWSLDLRRIHAPFRSQWFAADEAIFQLQTWPNLAQQPDHEAWLHLMAQTRNHAFSRAELRAVALRCGLAAERFEHGFALLVLFRHAVRLHDAPARIKPAVTTVAPSPAAEAPATPPGLLGRLRGRLRSMFSNS